MCGCRCGLDNFTAQLSFSCRFVADGSGRATLKFVLTSTTPSPTLQTAVPLVGEGFRPVVPVVMTPAEAAAAVVTKHQLPKSPSSSSKGSDDHGDDDFIAESDHDEPKSPLSGEDRAMAEALKAVERQLE